LHVVKRVASSALVVISHMMARSWLGWMLPM